MPLCSFAYTVTYSTEYEGPRIQVFPDENQNNDTQKNEEQKNNLYIYNNVITQTVNPGYTIYRIIPPPYSHFHVNTFGYDGVPHGYSYSGYSNIPQIPYSQISVPASHKDKNIPVIPQKH